MYNWSIFLLPPIVLNNLFAQNDLLNAEQTDLKPQKNVLSAKKKQRKNIFCFFFTEKALTRFKLKFPAVHIEFKVATLYNLKK